MRKGSNEYIKYGWIKWGIINEWNNGANERNSEGRIGRKEAINIGWMKWWKKLKKELIKVLKKNKWRKEVMQESTN